MSRWSTSTMAASWPSIRAVSLDSKVLMDADLQDPPEVIPQMSDTDNHLGTSTSFDVIASPPVITAVASIAQRLQMGSVAHVNTRVYHWRQAGLSQ